jgi:gas vesicle protein
MEQKKKLPEPVKKVLQKAGDSLSKIKLKKVFGSKEPIVNEYTKMAAGAGAATVGAAYGKEIAQAAKRGVKNIKKGVKAAKSDVKYGVEKIKKGVKTAVNKVPSGKRKIK